MPSTRETQPAETFPLLSDFPQRVLDAFHGIACIVDERFVVRSISRSWDELVGTLGADETIPEWVGASFISVFRDNEERTVIRRLMTSMLKRELEQFSQVVNLGTDATPLYLQVIIHPIWREGLFSGFLVQGIDMTQDHLNRLALMERDRELHTLRESVKSGQSSLQSVQERTERLMRQMERFSWATTAFGQSPADFGAAYCRAEAKFSNAQAAALFATTEQGWTLCCGWNLPDAAAEDPAANTNGEWMALGRSWGHEATWPVPLGDERGSIAMLLLFFDESVPEWSPEDRQNLEESASFATPLLRASLEIRSYAKQAEALKTFLNNFPIPFCRLNAAGIPQQWNDRFTSCCAQPPSSSKPAWDCFADETGKPLSERLSSGESEFTLPLADAQGKWSQQLTVYRVSEGAVMLVLPQPAKSPSAVPDEAFRTLTGGLADEFSNLLTGVLGHSSLLAVELGVSHAAVEDVRAIDRAARSAARLTRRLSALCASGRATAHLDLSAYLKHFVENERAEFFPAGTAGLTLTIPQCAVRMESTSVEIILDGMAEHARSAMSAASCPVWKLAAVGSTARVTLSYPGPAMIPAGWNGEKPQPAPGSKQHELFIAREAARATGGGLELVESAAGTDIVLTLPWESAAEASKMKS